MAAKYLQQQQKQPARLKVMHMIGAAKPGGAETFAVRLITALARRDDVDVLVVARKGGWVAKRLRAARVRVIEAPFGGWWDGLLGGGTSAIAQDAARRFMPQVIQGWMNRGTRFIPAGPWARMARLGGFYKLKNYFNKVSDLVCNTREICAYCEREGWPAGRVAYLPNFVPVPPAGWQAQRAAVRKKLRIPPKALVTVMFGRLHEVKGVDIALRALAKLPADVFLLLVGEGPERARLESLAAELGVEKRVRFVGWANEIAPYAAAADIWLAPSRHEPLGNTVLDAWAHGRPVVASAVGGMKMLIDDGISGLLVAAEDVAALVAAVMKLHKSAVLRRALVRGGKERLRKEFTEQVVVRAYLAYYRQLVKKRMQVDDGE